MKFACLLYASDAEWEAAPPEERRRTYERYAALERELREAGIMSDGAELRPASTATTVRVRDGDTLVTDGPFAETREQLGGLFVLECDTLDEAVEVARRIPAAEEGAVEVRPQYVLPAEEAS